jgi:hypothetical protein
MQGSWYIHTRWYACHVFTNKFSYTFFTNQVV